MTESSKKKYPNNVAQAMRERITPEGATLLRKQIQGEKPNYKFTDRTWFRKLAGDSSWTPQELIIISKFTGYTVEQLVTPKTADHVTA